MIDEYRLHIKAFINRSEMQEGKEGNYNSSREKKKNNGFLLFCLASESTALANLSVNIYTL